MHMPPSFSAPFSPRPLPTATTGAAESITTGSAAVTGTVNPGGVATTYQFEYGTSSSYGLTTPQQDAGAGSDRRRGARDALEPHHDTTYHYRLVATNAAGVAPRRRPHAEDRAPPRRRRSPAARRPA